MEKRPYEKLIVWQEAHALCLYVYKLTKSFPKEETFALTSQMRRASYSIPMNIVEGNARRSKKEQAHFLDIARGSLEELHYQSTLASSLLYCTEAEKDFMQATIGRVGFLLQKLRASIV